MTTTHSLTTAERRAIASQFDMLTVDSACGCGAQLTRGTLIRMRPIDGSRASFAQCGPCAAKELLPLFDLPYASEPTNAR